MEEYKSNRKITSGNSIFNALSFMIENQLKGAINTAIPVRVKTVHAGGSNNAVGYVDVVPLITQRDANNNAIDPTTLFRLPYCRLQGGIAAIVIDPVGDDAFLDEPNKGDVGIAIFAQQDTEALKKIDENDFSQQAAQDDEEEENPGEKNPTVQPGSFRSFSMSDGFYIGGFLNKKPEVFIELKQDKSITITANGANGITVNATGTGGVTVNSPKINVPSGDVTASGVSLVHHTHPGCSGGSTGEPY